MLFEKTDAMESGNSQSDASSSDNRLFTMQFESFSSKEHVTDDDDAVNSQVWGEIESESDAEFSEDYGMAKGRHGDFDLKFKSRFDMLRPV